MKTLSETRLPSLKDKLLAQAQPEPKKEEVKQSKITSKKRK